MIVKRLPVYQFNAVKVLAAQINIEVAQLAETKLIIAIFKQALDDATSIYDNRVKRALEFLSVKNSNFRYWCENLNVNPDWVEKLLIKEINQYYDYVFYQHVFIFCYAKIVLKLLKNGHLQLNQAIILLRLLCLKVGTNYFKPCYFKS